MSGTSRSNEKHVKRVRAPNAAGTFYPADRLVLINEISRMLRQANRVGPIPKAMIVPHAGLQYSGPIAASGYALLEPVRQKIARVVLVGPAHHVNFTGMAVPGDDAFQTPLGKVVVDRACLDQACQWPYVNLFDRAHLHEHSLEVHLPFLQMTLDSFALVPLLVGKVPADDVAAVLDGLWDDQQTLIVISSDLSHYHDSHSARIIDSETSNLIERCQWRHINGLRACGYGGIRGVLKIAQRRGLVVKTVDVRNSGETSGTKDRVVGYGCYVIS